MSEGGHGRFRRALVGIGVAVLVSLAALGLRAVSGLPFWGCLAIVVGAMMANGWLAAWEDDQPGGFNNPTPDDPSAPTNRPSNGVTKD